MIKNNKKFTPFAIFNLVLAVGAGLIGLSIGIYSIYHLKIVFGIFMILLSVFIIWQNYKTRNLNNY